MITSIAVLGLICIALSTVHYMKHKKADSSNGKYLWVGHGDNPFEAHKE